MSMKCRREEFGVPPTTQWGIHPSCHLLFHLPVALAQGSLGLFLSGRGGWGIWGPGGREWGNFIT